MVFGLVCVCVWAKQTTCINTRPKNNSSNNNKTIHTLSDFQMMRFLTKILEKIFLHLSFIQSMMDTTI